MMFRTESATAAVTPSAVTPSSAIRLRGGEMLHWRPRSALRVHVVSGRAWITWAGEPDDHFLDAGAAIELPAGCSAWVGAETTLSLVVDSTPGRPTPAVGSRLPAWPGGWARLRQAGAAALQRLSRGLSIQRRGRPIATP